MDNPIICVRQLTKKYGDFTAVDHLDLEIATGEIFGLLGPNGAGKSTTILMLLGLSEPTSGEIEVCGTDPVRSPLAVKRLVGYLPDNIGFYEGWTALENLILTAQLNGISYTDAKQRALSLLEKVGLQDVVEKKVGKFSRGMRQRLGLADSLIKEPKVLILDEPTLGLDPMGVKDFTSLIVRLSREEKLTVLLSSHQLYQVQQICDRVGLFIKGKLVADGPIQDLALRLFQDKTRHIQLKVHQTDIQRTRDILENMQAVKAIKQKDDMFQINADDMIVHQLAKMLVEQDITIAQLQQRTYGIEDIYAHYFEGGSTYEDK
ncbi:ABC transporter ATP-binding protein [Sphingobacterium corticibacterium]|uniref:ABC transporter ATP-binding protein n=2 Tax=Sphingobacterium corticibacterium TaxID=2484746 RepID=A0A4Q6XRT9_9SPHI|nr:ABC transporter ATP-binding protein [Sphingobacterium corticibacterium]